MGKLSSNELRGAGEGVKGGCSAYKKIMGGLSPS